MEIIKVEKVDGGYNVFFKDCDMIAFIHKEEEIKDLIKKGFIKEEKKSAKSKW